MKRQSFTPRKLCDFLAQLEESSESCLTLYVKPKSLPGYLTESGAQLSPLAGEIREALSDEVFLREAQRYRTGVAAFWSEGRNKHLVLPPFPLPEDKIFWGRAQTSRLRQLLEKERLLGVVLMTWGSYAIGVFQGPRLVEYKTGTGYIHKRTRKGGRSEKRFARRTEEQKKDFLRRAANRVEETLRGYHTDQIFFGGNRLILKPLLEECHYLSSRAERISKRILPARYADREALEKSMEQVNRSLVFSF